MATQLHAFRFATTGYGRCRRWAANCRFCLARHWRREGFCGCDRGLQIGGRKLVGRYEGGRSSKMRRRAFLPIEDIAQPAKAPAAPAAELTSVDSPPPFGVLKPKLGVPSSPEVESGCDPSARPDQK